MLDKTKVVSMIEKLHTINKHVYLVSSKINSFDKIIAHLNLPYKYKPVSELNNSIGFKIGTYITDNVVNCNHKLIIVTNQKIAPYIIIDTLLNDLAILQLEPPNLINPFNIMKLEKKVRFTKTLRTLQSLYNKHGYGYMVYYDTALKVNISARKQEIQEMMDHLK